MSGSILPLQVAADYKNDIPNAGTELRRQQTTHGGVQQRKGARIAWLQSGFSLSLVRGPGLRVTHLGESGGQPNSELNP